jgi:group II intron reverse transcriptase/maturase
LDRSIQQALLQVLQPIYDPTFSDHSHGFRPGRSAHDALREARAYAESGRTWVVDVDLSKFFDRVNHDLLMGRLAQRIGDRRVLGLIRRYLQVGILAEGVVGERHQGTPQGGPLSPLLANILLDEVDKELEKRGHAFVRYADDCNVFVRSKRSGERVMELLRRLYGRLRLVVNEEKSAVAPCWERPFLGYSMYQGKTSIGFYPAAKSVERLKVAVRSMTRRIVGRSMKDVVEWLAPRLQGWKNYFSLAAGRDRWRRLDGWIRRRLRALQLKQWKTSTTIYRKLRALGAPDKHARWVSAFTGRWWRAAWQSANAALPNRYFDGLGLPRLAA